MDPYTLAYYAGHASLSLRGATFTRTWRQDVQPWSGPKRPGVGTKLGTLKKRQRKRQSLNLPQRTNKTSVKW
jgi:hypothetical protein